MTQSPDPNFDPRDETDVRPQVSFAVAAGPHSLVARWPNLAKEWSRLAVPYYDMMAIDESRGVIRFHWNASQDLVDRAARWLESLPAVINVCRHYS